jgi:hypothetical protein
MRKMFGEVLGKLIGNFRLSRWSKFQRGKSAENFWLPFRHFQSHGAYS